MSPFLNISQGFFAYLKNIARYFKEHLPSVYGVLHLVLD